jgi:hypothetical protein|eukprot:COSAG02_NODE_2730_length_8142_cov_5.078080_1_plen_145_part_00
MCSLQNLAWQIFPYVRKTHNQIDSAGHMALLLTYTVSLILRNSEDDEVFADEIFPVEGYGWFIVLIFAVGLPAPTVYSLCVYNKEEMALWDAETALAEGKAAAPGMFESNPLAQASETTKATDRDFDTLPTSPEPVETDPTKIG